MIDIKYVAGRVKDDIVVRKLQFGFILKNMYSHPTERGCSLFSGTFIFLRILLYFLDIW